MKEHEKGRGYSLSASDRITYQGLLTFPEGDRDVTTGKNQAKQLDSEDMIEERRLGVSNDFTSFTVGRRFGAILADPPWQFENRTGKVAPEHRRLSRYSTLRLEEIKALPVNIAAADPSHLYLWVPNALLPDGIAVMQAWGFKYKSNIVWHKIRKDGGSDGRGVGFYFRNVTELLLFGVRGKNARTLKAGRTQVNYLKSRKREHSRKPDEQYDLIESCSSGPFLELFARGERSGWVNWGNQADESYVPTWKTYPNHSQSAISLAD